MATPTASNAPATTGIDRYIELVREFPLRPIRDDGQHARAVAVLDRLIDVGPDRSAEEEDYMIVLGLLVWKHESSIYEHPEPTPAERLRGLMENHRLDQAGLAAETGLPAQAVSDILQGRALIGPKEREALARRFGVAPTFFVEGDDRGTVQ